MQGRSCQSGAMTQREIDGDNPVLPGDVITNILIRLPVKSLIRFECVCKEWKNLFKTPSFIAEHLQHSTQQNPFLIFEDFGMHDTFRICLLNHEKRVIEVQSDPFFDSIRCVWAIDSSNGLICLGFANYPRSLSLLVWNPAIRTMRLVSGVLYGDFYGGFGFSPTVKDYKIVKILVSVNDYLVNHVELYSLNTGTWKEVLFGNLDGIAITSNGFNFNGAIFWIGSRQGVDEDEDDADIIVSFDIATEVFTLIPMPPSPFSVTNTSYPKYLTVYENKLGMLSHTLSEDFKSSLIHLWVMEEGTCASRERWGWTKKYTSSPYQGCLLLPMTVWKDEIVCDVDILPGPIDQIEDEDELNGGRETVMFNFKTNEFKTFDVRKFALGYGIFNYVETLVPVDNIHTE